MGGHIAFARSLVGRDGPWAGFRTFILIEKCIRRNPETCVDHVGVRVYTQNVGKLYSACVTFPQNAQSKMKIIISRKGFDSSYGGAASPILPDGTLLSLPIPLSSHISYGELQVNGHSLGPIVEDLTRGQITGRHGAHLDPDLMACAYPRRPGWRSIFGQVGAAQSHLALSGVDIGDLFLFFGWFRQTEVVSGRYRFVKDAPDLHVVFGWLQIGSILSVHRDSAPEWAIYHPHFHGAYGDNNTIYISRETLQLDGIQNVTGGGTFSQYRDGLCLTKPGCPRTVWQLPRWFYPTADKSPLSYHSNMKRWSRVSEHAVLHSVARGQEFVLDADQYPEAIVWARDLIASGSRQPRRPV